MQEVDGSSPFILTIFCLNLLTHLTITTVAGRVDTAKEEGRAEGREEGRAEGREEGRAEGIAMVAKMMDQG